MRRKVVLAVAVALACGVAAVAWAQSVQSRTDIFEFLNGFRTSRNGATFSGWRKGSATYDPASLVDAAGATTTVTVTGASLGDYAIPSFSVDLAGITLTAYVSAANTCSVRFQNESGGTLDLASGTLRCATIGQ